jgi:hypothetical protein
MSLRLPHLFVLVTLPLAACDTTEPVGEPVDAPIVLALSKNAVAVGEALEILGGNFVSGYRGYTKLTFVGEYFTEGGNVYAVEHTVRPHWEDGNRLTWAPVGPLQVPFSPTGDEIGTFYGHVIATNVNGDYSSVSEPTKVSLEVKPSIIVRRLQPVGADCSRPARRLLAGYAYEAEVEAIGFEPVNFTYTIDGEPGESMPRIERYPATARVHSVGPESINFVSVPNTDMFYVAQLSVGALGVDGIERGLNLAFGVHRPIEYVSTGEVKIAEIEPARPVSGCIAGGDTNGRTVTYSEQETDTRSRTVGVTWNESWLDQASGTSGGSRSTTNATRVTVNQSQTQGWESHWEINGGVEVGGSAGIPLLGEVGVKTNVGGAYGQRQSNSVTSGYTVGRDYSTTDTEQWAFTQTRGYTVAEGGSDFWTITSSSSTVTSFQGVILPGDFGVFYRQTTRLAVPGAIVNYNLCGVPEVVAEAYFYDYTWSVDLATGSSCPPFPESKLPPAQCNMSPCNYE